MLGTPYERTQVLCLGKLRNAVCVADCVGCSVASFRNIYSKLSKTLDADLRAHVPIVVMAGDMNFRVRGLGYEEAVEVIKEGE